MAEDLVGDLTTSKSIQLDLSGDRSSVGNRFADLPWWLVGIFLVSIWAGATIIYNENYRSVFDFVVTGLGVTAFASVVSYIIAVTLGLFTGLGRTSRNVIIRNVASFYVEFVRGIPILVLIFFFALVGVPTIVEAADAAAVWVAGLGLGPLSTLFSRISIENRDVPLLARAIVALALTYGAFEAEIFRAGIQSVGRGQMEAARSLGMSYGQAMRYVILPQAIRNVLPALGNDFVAIVKDSSLVSVLAVRDITHLARLHAGSSFRFREAFVTLAIMYLTITVLLSLLLRRFESRLRADG